MPMDVKSIELGSMLRLGLGLGLQRYRTANVLKHPRSTEQSNRKKKSSVRVITIFLILILTLNNCIFNSQHYL